MTFNFKSLLAAVSLLTGGLFGANAATDLQFSTVESPVWYQVKFTTGGAYLADQGADAEVKTANQADVDEQKWQLIGDKDNFTMRSKAGNYLAFSNSFYRTGSTGVAMALYVAGSNYEIGRVGVSNHLNQYQGTGAGRRLSEWNAGDKNNLLCFYDLAGDVATLPADPVELPEFSNGDTDYWFFLRFARGGNSMESKGIGNSVVRAKARPVDEMLWKLTGTADNMQLVNKAGGYLAYESSGDGGIKVAATPDANGFKAIWSTNATYEKALELHPNGAPEGHAINQFGGASFDADGKFGTWTIGDLNNCFYFVAENDMEYGEYTINGSTTWTPDNNLTLWYTAPGTDWMEWALPIGNGQFGAQILGGIHEEEISFTEKTLWSGTKDDHGGSNSYGYGSFQGFGNVLIQDLNAESGLGWTAETAVNDYYRTLDLTTATATVNYTAPDGTGYRREFIASYPDRVVAMHFTADGEGTINLNFKLDPGVDVRVATDVKAPEYVDGTGRFGGKLETVSYAAALKVIPTGGTMTSGADGITVKGASELLVILGGSTDYDPVSPTYTSGTSSLVSGLDAIVDAAAAKGWNSIYADHVADHQALFNRVEFTLEGGVNDRTTLALINEYNRGAGSASVTRQLEQLYFQYGRYLAIGSSRGIDVPNNLQGIWTGFNTNRWYNGSQHQPWNADIHANINIQMNYWPVESTNLSELHMPFLNYIINQATVQPQWRKNVTDHVSNPKATKGWTFFVENNIFGAGSSWGNNYVVANGWYCSHLWEHYLFTLDKEFLARALPTMWGACEFWIERLKLAADGTYECPNETSPEHGPGSQDAVAHAQQIVYELFSNTLDAIDVLGEAECNIPAADIATLRDRFSKLDRGLATEEFTAASGWSANGLVQGDKLLREWKYSPYTAGQNGHRHLSHLMCLYPFNHLTPGSELHTAAVNSLIQRGDAATGWSMGWKVNLWARAMDGDHTHTILKNALTSGIYKNLYDKHAPFQIDGNFGVTSGVTEMLMQSHLGYIHLLPALSSEWNAGSIAGLKARGDFSVSLDWKEGALNSAVIVSNQGQPLAVRLDKNIENMRVKLNGADVAPAVCHYVTTDIKTIELDNLKPGDKVEFAYDPAYVNPNVTNKGEGSAIETVEASGNFDVQVSNGKVTVSGVKVAEIVAMDLSGRLIAAGTSSELTIPAGSNVAIVKVTAVTGEVKTIKAIF